MPTENRSNSTELSKIVTEALVCMVSGVTGMTPPADEPLPGFIQAPIDRAVTRISDFLAQPAQQHQGEPVPTFDNCIDARTYIADLFKQRLRRHDFDQYITERLAGDFAFALANWLLAEGNADPAEVEQLRDQLKSSEIELKAVVAEHDESLSRLAEAQALLREVGDSGFMVDGQIMPSHEAVALQERVEASISASAEPSAVTEKKS